MSFRWALPIAAVLLATGFILFTECADESEALNEGYILDWDGNDLTATGSGDFQSDPGWTALENLTIVPEGGEVSIPDEAFQNNATLRTVTIQGSVGSLGGEHAFYNCDALETVIVHGSVGSIGFSAISYCGALTTVTIEGSVGHVGECAF